MLSSLSLAAAAAAAAPGAPERLVHRFLEVALSPSGAFVATVEGDAPRSGRAPPVRELVIRRTDGSGSVRTVALPCGSVPECWPSSPAWPRASAQLTFALRTPGSHARALYRVDTDGGHLTELLRFDGTITALRYGPDGRLSMLATEAAVKEVGATQAGAPVTGELGAAPPEQRIAILEGGRLAWASPADLYVYEYDWRPDGRGFVGTAAAGDGDSKWWVAALYVFEAGAPTARVIYRPSSAQQQLAAPTVAPDGQSVVFIQGLMSDFGRTGGDVWRVPLAGGPAVNATPRLRASATGLTFDCSGRLLVTLLAGDETQIVELRRRRRADAALARRRDARRRRGRHRARLSFGADRDGARELHRAAGARARTDGRLEAADRGQRRADDAAQGPQHPLEERRL